MVLPEHRDGFVQSANYRLELLKRADSINGTGVTTDGLR